VGRNFAVLATTTLAGQAIGFAVLIVIARRVTPHQIGAWYFANMVAQYFAIGMTLGMLNLATRDIARDPGSIRRVTGEVLVWQLAAAAVMYIVLVALAHPVLAPSALAASLLPIAGLYFVVGAFSIDWGLQAVHRGAIVGILALTGQVAYAALALATLTHGAAEVTRYAWANVFGLLVSATLTGIVFIRLCGRPAFRWQPKAIVARAHRSLPFAASILVVQAYTTLGPVLLGAVGTVAQAGLYGVAFRFPVALIMLSKFWVTTVYPHSAAVARAEPNRFSRQITLLSRVAIRFGLPLVAITALIARATMVEVFGRQYAAAGAPFALLTLVAVVLFLSVNLANSLQALDLERIYMWIAVLGLGLNVAVNLALIPELGAVAPPIALLAAEGTIAVLAWRHIRRRLPTLAFGLDGIWRMLPGLLLAVVTVEALASEPAIIRGIAGMLVYLACAYPLGIYRTLAK
jgi:PST family polysaccharide transporter